MGSRRAAAKRRKRLRWILGEAALRGRSRLRLQRGRLPVRWCGPSVVGEPEEAGTSVVDEAGTSAVGDPESAVEVPSVLSFDCSTRSGSLAESAAKVLSSSPEAAVVEDFSSPPHRPRNFRVNVSKMPSLRSEDSVRSTAVWD